REDPARYLRLSISRLREYFKFWPEENSGRASNYARMLSSGIFFPFALLGLMLLLFCRFKGHPTETQPKAPGTSLLLLLGAGYALVHLLTWTLIRYRLPVDAMLVPVAAVGLVAGLRCFKRNHKLYGFIG
ncbi:MAG: hypothetical protein JXA73_26145, partial [Acidobacteria bacterium]|nr:hypothetical protein [Acidobacteriota bacterium]